MRFRKCFANVPKRKIKRINLQENKTNCLYCFTVVAACGSCADVLVELKFFCIKIGLV